MFFINLIGVIDGELKNTPSISAFNGIAFNPQKVKLGNLFIGKKEEIDKALANGAYGIVSTEFDITDNEIAWIKVKDLKETKDRLLRYYIVRNSIKIVYLNSVEKEILEYIQECNKNIFFVDNKNIEENIIRYNNLKDKDKFLTIFTNQRFFQRLDFKEAFIKKQELKLLSNTMFLTTFVYREKIYQNIKLPKIFLSNLNKVLNIFDEVSIKYNINRLNFTNHFKPFFIDRFFSILPFGQSSKVLIMESDKVFLPIEVEYLQNSTPWARFVLFLPQKIDLKIKENIDIFYYKTIEELINLNLKNYNFVLIYDNQHNLENFLHKKSKESQKTLL